MSEQRRALELLDEASTEYYQCNAIVLLRSADDEISVRTNLVAREKLDAAVIDIGLIEAATFLRSIADSLYEPF